MKKTASPKRNSPVGASLEVTNTKGWNLFIYWLQKTRRYYRGISTAREVFFFKKEEAERKKNVKIKEKSAKLLSKKMEHF